MFLFTKRPECLKHNQTFIFREISVFCRLCLVRINLTLNYGCVYKTSHHHASLSQHYFFMCFALSQHHAALTLSSVLLYLNITPLMCFVFSQHAVLALPCPSIKELLMLRKSKLSKQLPDQLMPYV